MPKSSPKCRLWLWIHIGFGFYFFFLVCCMYIAYIISVTRWNTQNSREQIAFIYTTSATLTSKLYLLLFGLLLPLIINRLVKSVVLLFYISVGRVHFELSFILYVLHACDCIRVKEESKICYKYIIDSACRCEGNTIHIQKTNTQRSIDIQTHIFGRLCVLWVDGFCSASIVSQQNNKWNCIQLTNEMEKDDAKTTLTIDVNKCIISNESIVYYFTHSW